MERFNLRTANLSDLPDIMRLQNQAYLPELREDDSIFESRIHVAPEYCFVAELQEALVGYVIAHPWSDHSSPGLGRVIDSLPEGADAIHIHDLAVDSSFRGRGVARLLLERLHTASPAHFKFSTLVAVQGASEFWKHLGFGDEGPARAYDSGARFMRQRLR